MLKVIVSFMFGLLMITAFFLYFVVVISLLNFVSILRDKEEEKVSFKDVLVETLEDKLDEGILDIFADLAIFFILNMIIAIIGAVALSII